MYIKVYKLGLKSRTFNSSNCDNQMLVQINGIKYIIWIKQKNKIKYINKTKQANKSFIQTISYYTPRFVFNNKIEI